MRTNAELNQKLTEAIARFFEHPSWYSHHCLEASFHDHLWFWSLLHEKEKIFENARQQLYEREHANIGLVGRYMARHPETTRDEIAAYLTSCWREIADLIGFPNHKNAGNPRES